jgi:hypothetical protein
MDRKNASLCSETDRRIGEARPVAPGLSRCWGERDRKNADRRLEIDRRVGGGWRLLRLVALLTALGVGLITPRQTGAQGTGGNAGPAQQPVSSKDQTKQSEKPAKPDVGTGATTPADEATGAIPASDQALSARYRFSEVYGVEEDAAHPEVITTYQVGVKLTSKTVTERREGAPVREEITQSVWYTERSAKVGRLGDVVEAMRRYDRVDLGKPAATRPPKPPLFEGLTIWYQRRAAQEPLILSLTENHPLRELEYNGITRQIFLPQLTSFLPMTPVRVGDSWKIPLKSAHCLVIEQPEQEDYEMRATLSEVRKAPTGTTLIAMIGVTATLSLPINGPCATNAVIEFSFEPPVAVPPAAGSISGDKADEPATRPAPAKRSDVGVVDARGRITNVRMATAATTPLPESDGRLKQTITYEVLMRRRALPADYAPLILPEPRPTPTEANSWLIVDDPAGRIHLRHPQELKIQPSEPDTLDFAADERPDGGRDAFVIQFPPGPEDPQGEARFRNTDAFRRTIEKDWAQKKYETVLGPQGWLPEADWPGLKVYRKELAVKTSTTPVAGKNVPRIYLDYYLVLGKRNECLHVWSMTNGEDQAAVRKVAESMIKSIQFGAEPARAVGAEPAGAPAGAPPESRPAGAGSPRPAPPAAPTAPPQ